MTAGYVFAERSARIQALFPERSARIQALFPERSEGSPRSDGLKAGAESRAMGFFAPLRKQTTAPLRNQRGALKKCR